MRSVLGGDDRARRETRPRQPMPGDRPASLKEWCVLAFLLALSSSLMRDPAWLLGTFLHARSSAQMTASAFRNAFRSSWPGAKWAGWAQAWGTRPGAQGERSAQVGLINTWGWGQAGEEAFSPACRVRARTARPAQPPPAQPAPPHAPQRPPPAGRARTPPCPHPTSTPAMC